MNKKSNILFLIVFLLGTIGGSLPGNATGGGKGNNSEITVYNGSDIPVDILHYVLAESSSFFGYTPTQMIRMYYQCSCIEVTQTGHNRYRVEMGGLGIEILIDMSSTHQSGKPGGSRK